MTGGHMCLLRVWDIESGNCLSTLQGHKGAIYACCFGETNQQVLSASEDELAMLWDTETGADTAQAFWGHKGKVQDCAFTPDYQSVVTASHDRTLKLWKLNGKCVTTFEGSSRFRTCCVSPNGKLVVSGDDQAEVRLWELNGRCRCVLQGHTAPVFVCRFSPDGTLLASASKDGCIRLWDWVGGSCLKELCGMDLQQLYCVDFSSDGRFLVSSGEGNEMQVSHVLVLPTVSTLFWAGLVSRTAPF